MTSIESSFSIHSRRFGFIFSGLFLAGLTALICMTETSTCIAAAINYSLSAAPNPVCVNTPLLVDVVPSCYGGEGDPLTISAKVGSTTVTLTADGQGGFVGTNYPSTPGTVTVTATDSCGDPFPPVTVTVVELNDITLVSDPPHSQWAHTYADANRDHAVLKSPITGDVVTFGLNMIPNNATAATLITWSGATPSSDNLTATFPATAVAGPSPVTASGCGCTTDPYTVWIFWGSVSYNFSGPLSSGDGLSFTGWSGFSFPNSAGSFVGLVNANTTMLAVNRVEIIGTLAPTGIGNLVGNIFTFNPQTLDYYIWSTTGDQDGDQLATVTSSTPGSHHGPKNDTALPQQTSPVGDQIFALDAPGVGQNVPATGYEGNADNFKDYIYIGSVIASDPGYWYSHVRGTFSGSTISASPCSAGAGSPTLPTTWGDPNW